MIPAAGAADEADEAVPGPALAVLLTLGWLAGWSLLLAALPR